MLKKLTYILIGYLLALVLSQASPTTASTSALFVILGLVLLGLLTKSLMDYQAAQNPEPEEESEDNAFIQEGWSYLDEDTLDTRNMQLREGVSCIGCGESDVMYDGEVVQITEEGVKDWGIIEGCQTCEIWIWTDSEGDIVPMDKWVDVDKEDDYDGGPRGA